MNTLNRTLKPGEKVILKSGVMRDEYDSLEWRTVEVDGDNFGNYEFTTGTCLFVKFKDGEIVRMSGMDIDAAATNALTEPPTAAEQTEASYGDLDLSQDPTVQRLNAAAGYDVFTALATKSPERVRWEQDYLEKRRRHTR